MRHSSALARAVVSSLVFARVSVAHDGAASPGDSSGFVYSQSFAFEYSHPNGSLEDEYTTARPVVDHPSTRVNEDKGESSTQGFHIVWEDNQQQRQQQRSPALTWMSRAEEEFQADAYAFDSPVDLRFFSENNFGNVQGESEEEDDDDDENNDNDGSCSMLSNASISRMRFTSAYDDEGGRNSQRSTATSTKTDRTKIRGGAQPIQSSSALSSSVKHSLVRALSIRRGGAVTRTLGSQVLQRLYVAALVTLIFEGCIGHILEFLKIVMQTSPVKTTYAAVIRDITAEKGIGGLWDGFVPWGIVQATSKGAVFGVAQATASRILMPLAEKGVMPETLALTLAGGIAGGIQGYVLSPTLLLKTRVMTNEVFRKKLSLWKTTVLSATIGFDVVRAEGLGTLMKGANIFATKRVFDWSTRYFFAELIESLLRVRNGGQPLSLTEKSASSFLGGVFSTCATLPLDVLVAKTQDAKLAGVRTSAFTLFRQELKEKGWSGLSEDYLSGFMARLLHVCLTVVVMKTLVPLVYDIMFG